MAEVSRITPESSYCVQPNGKFTSLCLNVNNLQLHWVAIEWLVIQNQSFVWRVAY